MPPRGCLPNPCPMGAVDSRVTSLRRCGASCHSKGLAGLVEATSRQGSCRGGLLCPLCSLWSWRRSASLQLRPYLGLPPLSCLVWRRSWLRLPVHSYRGTKSVPPFLYTDSAIHTINDESDYAYD